MHELLWRRHHRRQIMAADLLLRLSLHTCARYCATLAGNIAWSVYNVCVANSSHPHLMCLDLRARVSAVALRVTIYASTTLFRGSHGNICVVLAPGRLA